MKYYWLFFYVLIHVFSASLAKINVDELRCLVCEASIKELEKAVSKLDPNKRAEVGGGRLDAHGNYKTKSVSLSKSETHLSEMIDSICEKMEDYVRATHKSNGKLTLINLLGDNGQMNSLMSEVDIIQDDDLNKSLKYYCEGIMEEHEDNIIKLIINQENVTRSVCSKETKLCKHSRNEEL